MEDPSLALEVLSRDPLRIGISTRALFDLEQEHRVFMEEGVHAYIEHQLQEEEEVIGQGSGFEVIKRLLALNDERHPPLVEVVLLSKNSPDLSLRAFNSIEKYGLNIKTGSFISGRSLAPFVSAWNIDLFLSGDADDVKAAVTAGTAAARLGVAPKERQEVLEDEVRIAFDGDAVVFSAESDEIYKCEGLEAFLNHAHARVVHTLRAWGTPADEAHFVGIKEKAPILKAMGAHMFFDDQQKHVEGASLVVPSGHVPGPHNPDDLIIPAGH